MSRKPPILFPRLLKGLEEFGERLRLARLRRHFSASTVAARAGISRVTLRKAEEGDPGVSLGAYARILTVLSLEGDLSNLAKDDELGRQLQDLELPARRERRS